MKLWILFYTDDNLVPDDCGVVHETLEAAKEAQANHPDKEIVGIYEVEVLRKGVPPENQNLTWTKVKKGK